MVSTVTLRLNFRESVAWQKSCKIETLRDDQGYHNLFGTDHYFLRWGCKISQKNISAQQNCWKQKACKESPEDQAVFTYHAGPVFEQKKNLAKGIAHQKTKITHNL